MLYGEYSCSYSGTACYKREIPYTDYEIKTEYINGKRQEQRVPVTKYRIETDKQPANGTFTKEIGGCYLLSDDLYEKLKQGNNEDLVLELESFVEENAPNLIEESVQIIDNSFKNNDGIFTYSDWNVYSKPIEKTIERAEADYKKYVELSCENAAKDLIQGDYSRNVRCNYNTDEYKEFMLYLPLQIIEYAYNENFYIAVQLLNNKFYAASMTYPTFVNKEMSSKKKEVDKLNNKLSSLEKKRTTFVAFSVICGILLGFILLFNLLEIEMFIAVFCYCIIALIIFIILATVFAAKVSKVKKQVKKITAEYKKEKKEFDSIHSNVLKTTAKAFLDEYEKTKSVESANRAAANISDYNVDIGTIRRSMFGFQKINVAVLKEKANEKKVATQKENQIIDSNSDATFCLTSVGVKKIEVINIIRKELGLELYEAKKIIDSVPTHINCKDNLIANDIIIKLQNAGATIEGGNYNTTAEENSIAEDNDAPLCNNCLATLKPDEKVCHVCGYKTVEVKVYGK